MAFGRAFTFLLCTLFCKECLCFPLLHLTPAVSPVSQNSKDSAFLLEMLSAERLDERASLTVTRLQSVLVEAAAGFSNSKVSDALLELRLESEATGGSREQELQLRDPGDAVVVEAATVSPADSPADSPAAEFVNAKESETLRVLRLQSLQDLTGRRPPQIVGDAVIVEAEANTGVARKA